MGPRGQQMDATVMDYVENQSYARHCSGEFATHHGNDGGARQIRFAKFLQNFFDGGDGAELFLHAVRCWLYVVPPFGGFDSDSA